ncbi:hypothetical protein LZ32DRAFT_242354 [Colletotrichum eremochloae]|nr:hypothetical protein LZ32DRAFT_242354 [Colletotrichum eremochloae]
MTVLLDYTSDFRPTDMRDYVYALYGILKHASRCRSVDVPCTIANCHPSVSVSDSFLIVTRYLISDGDCVDVTCYARRGGIDLCTNFVRHQSQWQFPREHLDLPS